MSKGKRSYSEDEKASALALLVMNGGNIKKTAEDLKMPQSTLREWRDGEHVNEAVTKKRDIKKESLAEVFENLARVLAEWSLANFKYSHLPQVAKNHGVGMRTVEGWLAALKTDKELAALFDAAKEELLTRDQAPSPCSRGSTRKPGPVTTAAA
jgi:transposase-like protein